VVKPPYNHYADVFGHAVVSINSAMNDVVIKCYPGMASSACVAVDNLFGDDILGSLAGDDTIFIITRDTEKATRLVAKLKNLL
jgi:transcriptional regulator of arginine metabolism